MRTALSTALRAPRESAKGIAMRLSSLGAEAIALDATLPEELALALLASELPVVAVEWRGRARLCAPDKDERTVAVDTAGRALRRAGDRGVKLGVITLGAAD